MKAFAIAIVVASLAVGCEKKSTEGAAPSASVSAAAPAPSASAAAAAPSDSVPPLASAAPSAAAAPFNVPTEDQYEQKAQAAISSTAAAEAELKKLEQEIGQ